LLTDWDNRFKFLNNCLTTITQIDVKI